MDLKKLLIPAVLFYAIALNAQQLAFPGAEGFGRYATGGRNGTVYHVTNLDDSGPGSLRDAVSQSNRIVVFDVGGVIHINERIVIYSNITVAGQTAPGDGITIYGNGIALNDHSGNNIIRHIRVRMGKNGDSGKDAIGISAGTNYMFDHVSVSWGRDGTFDINGSGIDDISIQNCIIAQGINNENHSTGGLMQSGKFSIIRTLWIDNKTRNPKGRGPIEYINSLIYNWRTDGFIMGDTEGVSECNLIGNYFIAGPESDVNAYITNTTPTFYLYPEDNWLDTDKDGVLDGRELVSGDGDYKTATIMNSPFNYPSVNTLLTAQEAVDHIIDSAGASLARDAVDKLLIRQLESFGKEGRIINTEDDNGIEGAVGIVYNGPKPQDTDNDGMPDDWEDANGTDKNKDDAMIISGNGYANIENYINSIKTGFPYLKPPYNLQKKSVTKTSVTLTWSSDEEDADELVIEYGTSPDNFTSSVSVAGDATEGTITGLQSGTAYYFRIKSVNATLESDYSTVLMVETEPEPTLPDACINPSPGNGATINFRNDVLLTWENETNSLGGTLHYDVYFGTSEGSMDPVSSGQTEKYWSAGNLNASTTYYWSVTATNDLGSTEGDTWSFYVGSSSPDKVLYIPFDETSGDVAMNAAGGNDAEALYMTPSWEEGIMGNAIYFSASPDSGCMVVDHYSDLAMGTKAFTISLWYKSDGGGISDIYLLHKGTHDASYGALGSGKWIGIQYQAGKRLTFAIDDNATKSDLNINADPDQYFNGEWHHLVCMRDIYDDVLKVYIDGVEIQERSDDTGDISEEAEFVIGNCNYNFDTPFPGSMDELTVYNDALTDDDVAYLYHSELPVILRSHYRINELTVFPVPFTDRITIELPSDQGNAGKLMIFDLAGKVVWQSSIRNQGSRITINGLGRLPAGFYTCVVYSDSKFFVSKLLKN